MLPTRHVPISDLVGRFGEQRLQGRVLQGLSGTGMIEHALERLLQPDCFPDFLGGHAGVVRVGEELLDLVPLPEVNERVFVTRTRPAFRVLPGTIEKAQRRTWRYLHGIEIVEIAIIIAIELAGEHEILVIDDEEAALEYCDEVLALLPWLSPLFPPSNCTL